MSAITPSNLPACRGKLSYPSLSKAEAFRKAKGMFALDPYSCPDCGGFHLGRNPKTRGMKIMADPLSKKAKREAKKGARAGRPRKDGAREPNGRLQRGKPREPADAVALAARARHGRVSVEEAKDQKAGTFIGLLFIHGRETGLSRDQYDALEQYKSIRDDYLRAIAAPHAGVASEGGGGGSEISDAYVSWCSKARQRYDECKAAIRYEQEGNRVDNLWAALDLCVHQDMRLWHMVGQLRVTANCLARHFRA